MSLHQRRRRAARAPLGPHKAFGQPSRRPSQPNPADPLAEGQFRLTTFCDNGSAGLSGIKISARMKGASVIDPAPARFSLSANCTCIDAELNAVLDAGALRMIDGLQVAGPCAARYY